MLSDDLNELEYFQEAIKKANEYRAAKYMNKDDFLSLIELEKAGELSLFEQESLERYQLIEWQQLLYHNRFIYFRLAELFTRNKLSISEFQHMFLVIYSFHLRIERTLRSSPEQIQRLKITDKADGFASIIVQLYVILIEFKENGKDLKETVKITRVLKQILKAFQTYQ